MPQYLALIHTVDGDWSDSQYAGMIADYEAFTTAAAAVLRGGNALMPATTATTIRVKGRGGDVVATDGPFTETKEVLGGYFVLECADLDEALSWAAQIPGAWDGAVEVRPILQRG